MIVAVPMPAPMHSVTSAGRQVAPLELVEQRAEDHRAGRAERMAHGDGAAVDVDLGVVEVERLQVAQHDRRERLVDLEQVDVGERHAGALEHLLGHVDRAGEHHGGLRADIGERLDPGARLQAGAAAGLLVADQHGGGAVDDAGGVAGVVHVIDRLDLGMRLHGDRIEAADLAHLHEGGLELRQRLHGGGRPHVLVLGEDGEAVRRPSPA